jgi:ribosomal-protein-alanine N-acetyltransferase
MYGGLNIWIFIVKNRSGTNKSKKAGFLKTTRLIFRPWLETDIELALGLWSDPRVTKFIDTREKLSADDVRSLLFQEIASEKEYGVQYWPIFLRSNNDHVGCCGLRTYKPTQNIFEIGFHIRAEHWGYGFASEAALGVMGYAFNVLSVRALFAGHNPGNIASRHILLKLGFHYTHDEYYAPTGLYHPSYMLTDDEYRRIQKY